MRIIIIGAGEVGQYLAKSLSEEAKDVIVIDRDAQRLQSIQEHLDVQTIQGEGSSQSVLEQAGAQQADILIAVTDRDEVNLMACVVSNVYFNIAKKVARVRNPEYKTIPILTKLGIDMAIGPEKEAAGSIFKLLKIPEASEVMDFENGRVWIVGSKVTNKTPFVNSPLKELDYLKELDILIAAIMRDEHVMIPKGNDCIVPGDTIYTITPHEQLPDLNKALGNRQDKVQNVMIIGGSMIGEYLAHQLEEQEINIRLVDSRKARCYELAEAFRYTIVLHGDPTDEKFLTTENISEMDVVVAASDDEQMNILVALLAKRLGALKTICVVNKSDYIPLANSIGINSVVSPRLSAANAILRFVRQGRVLSVGTLRENEAEAIEVVAQPTSKIVNKPIYQINFPKDAIIGAIIRDEETIIPKGNHMIVPGDRIIIFTLTKAIKKVENALAIKTSKGTKSLT